LSQIDIAKQSARGSLLLFVGNFLSAVILTVSTIIVARLLSPERLGAYALVILIPSIFQILVGFGVSAAITRYSAYHIAKGEENLAKRFATNGMIFLLLFGIALSVASFLGSGYLSLVVLRRPELTQLVQYASILVLAQTVLQSSISSLMGWNSMGLSSLSSILQALLRLSIAPALILLGFGVFGALAGHIVSTIIAGAVALLALYIFRLRPKTKEDGKGRFFADIREMVSYGMPLYAGSVVSGFAGQYLTIVLAAIAVNAVVGYYSAASYFTIAISVTSSAITLALFPAFASLEGIRANLGLAFNYSVKYLAFFICPIILFLLGASDDLIKVVLGVSYSPAAPYLRLLSLSNLPQVIGSSVVGVFFNGVGKTRLTLALNIISAAVLFVLAPLLASLFGLGVNGLIFATLISNFVATIAGLYFARAYLNARVDLKPVLSIFIASALAYAAVLLLSLLHLLAAVALAADLIIFPVAYLTLAPLLGAIDEDDIVRLSIAISDLGIIARALGPILKYERTILNRARHSSAR
jgi:O-antigen/teichoic acid export membrane protein